MNCKKCGTKLPGYAKYCLSCGEKVNLSKAATGEVDKFAGIEEQPEGYEDIWTGLFSGIQGHPVIIMLIVKAVSIIKILVGILTTVLSFFLFSKRELYGGIMGIVFFSSGMTNIILRWNLSRFFSAKENKFFKSEFLFEKNLAPSVFSMHFNRIRTFFRFAKS